MSTVEAPAPVQIQPAPRFVFQNVSGEVYGNLLEAIGENHVPSPTTGVGRN